MVVVRAQETVSCQSKGLVLNHHHGTCSFFRPLARILLNSFAAFQSAANVSDSVPIETSHEDMIHDAQLDYYGKRLATCSSDRTVRIFNVVDGNASKTAGPPQVLKGCVTTVLSTINFVKKYPPPATLVQSGKSHGLIRSLAPSSPAAPTTERS